jgi:hypothetical protein
VRDHDFVTDLNTPEMLWIRDLDGFEAAVGSLKRNFLVDRIDRLDRHNQRVPLARGRPVDSFIE